MDGAEEITATPTTETMPVNTVENLITAVKIAGSKTNKGNKDSSEIREITRISMAKINMATTT